VNGPVEDRPTALCHMAQIRPRPGSLSRADVAALERPDERLGRLARILGGQHSGNLGDAFGKGSAATLAWASRPAQPLLRGAGNERLLRRILLVSAAGRDNRRKWPVGARPGTAVGTAAKPAARVRKQRCG